MQPERVESNHMAVFISGIWRQECGPNIRHEYELYGRDPVTGNLELMLIGWSDPFLTVMN